MARDAKDAAVGHAAKRVIEGSRLGRKVDPADIETVKAFAPSSQMTYAKRARDSAAGLSRV